MKLSLLTLLSLFVFISACSNFSLRNPSSASDKPRHLIVTVHGLSGSAQTWGYFPEATTNYLDNLDTKFDTKVVNYVYPTGQNENLSSFDFSDGLGEYIKEQFKDRPITKDDKISLICHSQGGVIAYMWFFANVMQNRNLNYIKQVDSIITLGTPFWGSKLSSMIMKKGRFDIIPLVKAFAGENYRMTRREIGDLAFSSDTINLLRNIAVQMDSNPELDKLIASLPIRLINISGVLPENEDSIYIDKTKAEQSNLIKKVINYVYRFSGASSIAKGQRVESDIAVIAPSSRWNFIYAQPHKINQATEVNEKEFTHFNHLLDRSKFVFTESVHLPFDKENTLSMAYVNKGCLEVDTCNHPTYRYILEELANCGPNSGQNKCNSKAYENIIQKMNSVNLDQNKTNKNILQSLRTFAIQISIKLKPGQIDRFPVKYFTQKNRSQIEPGNYDVWTLNEPALIGQVFNLNRNKERISIASNDLYTIRLGEKIERHAVDLVSRYSNDEDQFDRLRFNVIGSIDNKQPVDNQTYSVPLEVNLPGLPPVKINALVQPSYSTYIELDYTP